MSIGVYLARHFSIVPFINAIDTMRMANKLSGTNLFEWTLISHDGKPIEAINGMTVIVDMALKDAEYFPNVICVSGFDPVIEVRPPIKFWLRKLNSLGAHLGALGAATLFLAEAGLLDGYRATIHWQYMESFKEKFPNTTITRSLFEIDRDRFTCAGGTSSMDMMLHFIGRHFGHTLAGEVSDQFIIGEVREASSHQRLSCRARLGITNIRLLRIIELMEEHIEEPLKLPQISSLAKVSQRQMERLFKEQAGFSPIQFYTQLRLSCARRLLHQSEMSVLEIGIASGFGSSEHFARSYKLAFGVTPTADRRSVRGFVA